MGPVFESFIWKIKRGGSFIFKFKVREATTTTNTKTTTSKGILFISQITLNLASLSKEWDQILQLYSIRKCTFCANLCFFSHTYVVRLPILKNIFALMQVHEIKCTFVSTNARLDHFSNANDLIFKQKRSSLLSAKKLLHLSQLGNFRKRWQAESFQSLFTF